MKFRLEWMILAVAFLMTFSFFFALQSYPPAIPQVMEEFGLSHAEAGTLMSLVNLAGIFLALPAGMLSFRWGLRRVGALSLVICCAGSLITFLGTSFPQLAVGRTILGIGGAMTIVSGFSMVPLWFPKERGGMAMGIKALDLPIATVLALNLLPYVVAGYGWRTCFAISTALLLAATFAFLLLFREKPNENEKEKESAFSGLRNGQMWLLGLVWGLISTATLSYTTWAGPFFIEVRNVPTNLAFFMGSITYITLIVLNPLIGTLSDRSDRRKAFIMASTALMGCAYALISSLSVPLLFLPVAMLGLSTFYAPPLFASVSEILPKERASLGFSILFTCSFAGYFVGPTLVGYTKDLFPSGGPSFLTMAVFCFLALLCAGRLKTR